MERNTSFIPDEFRVLTQIGLALITAIGIIMGSYVIAATDYDMFVLAGMIGLIITFLIVNRPALGVILLVFFVYLNLSSVLEEQFGIPSINQALVALVAVSILGTKIIIKREKLFFGLAGILMIVHGAILILTILFADLTADFSVVMDIIKDLMILFIILQVSNKEQAWKSMQWVLLVAAAFLSVLASYQVITGNYAFNFWGLANAPIHQIVEGFDSLRPTGPLEDPNFFAQMLLFTIPIGVYRVFGETSRSNKLVAAALTAIIIFAVIGTYSRSAFVSLIIIAIFIAMERRMNLYRLGLVALAAVVIVLPILPVGFTERLSTLTELTSIFDNNADSVTEASLRGRTSQFLVAMDMFVDYPIMGIGYNNYSAYYQEYASGVGLDNRLQNREAHTLYLEALAETGLVGFGAFILMTAYILDALRRAKTQVKSVGRSDLIPWIAGAQMALIVYLINSLTLHDDYIRYLRLTYALAIGALILANTVYEQNKATALSSRVKRKQIQDLM